MYSTENEEKSSVCERWNRTIKTQMWKQFTIQGNTMYLDMLPKILKQYNNTKHSSIKMTPIEASKKKNEGVVYFNLYGDMETLKQKPKFKIGDMVRISKYKRKVFDKGYTPNWSEEVFTVDKIQYTNPITYKLKDLRGEDIQGSFYELELLEAKQDVFRIDKIIRRDYKKKQALVSWKGYEINIGGNDSLPLTWNDKNSIYINESGLYSLILRSDMDNAKKFKRWITREVLPSIRKNGRYELNHKPFKMLSFNIQTEYDLHKKVVNFIRNHYPKALLNVTLGENQINSNMRLRSYNLGYQKGSPDLIIQNLHKSYSGFAIEFKSPQGYGNLSEYQNVMLQEYTNNGFKVLLSNDYDKILKEIIHYFDDIRILCSHCFRKFKSSKTLKNHTNYIHRYKQKMIYSFI